MAVCCKILNAEIYIAVHHISVTFLDQRPDHIDNFLHVARNSRIEVHPANIQAIHHFEIRLDIPVGQFIPGNSRFRRSVDNLVIHIRKVLDMSHRQALPFKIAVNDVPDDKRAGIADMRMIIGRHAADVNLDLSRFRRRKQFFFLGQRVIHFQIHGPTSRIIIAGAPFILPAPWNDECGRWSVLRPATESAPPVPAHASCPSTPPVPA